MKHNSSLRGLNLNGSTIGVYGFAALINAPKHNSTLTYLYTSNDDVANGASLCDFLCSVLLRRKPLCREKPDQLRCSSGHGLEVRDSSLRPVMLEHRFHGFLVFAAEEPSRSFDLDESICSR